MPIDDNGSAMHLPKKRFKAHYSFVYRATVHPFIGQLLVLFLLFRCLTNIYIPFTPR